MGIYFRGGMFLRREGGGEDGFSKLLIHWRRDEKEVGDFTCFRSRGFASGRMNVRSII